MALSTFSTVGSYIKNNQVVSVPVAPSASPNIWFKFASGDTFTTSSLTNYGTDSGFTFSNNTSYTKTNNTMGNGSNISLGGNPFTVNNVTQPTSGYSLSYWLYCKGTNGGAFGNFTLWGNNLGCHYGSPYSANQSVYVQMTASTGAWIFGNNQDGTGALQILSPNVVLSVPGFYHFVWVWNSTNTTFQIYINNSLVGSGTYAYGATTTRNNTIASNNVSNSGGSTNATSSTFYSGTQFQASSYYGYMADVRLYTNYCLTANNVNYLYNNPTFTTTYRN